MPAFAAEVEVRRIGKGALWADLVQSRTTTAAEVHFVWIIGLALWAFHRRYSPSMRIVELCALPICACMGDYSAEVPKIKQETGYEQENIPGTETSDRTGWQALFPLEAVTFFNNAQGHSFRKKAARLQ